MPGCRICSQVLVQGEKEKLKGKQKELSKSETGAKRPQAVGWCAGNQREVASELPMSTQAHRKSAPPGGHAQVTCMNIWMQFWM